MKEYDEDEAVKLMCAAAGLSGDEATDAAFEVLDIIYDYYDANGELEIDAEGGDDDCAAPISDYVAAQLAKSPAAMALSTEQIAKMVIAELEYEDSII